MEILAFDRRFDRTSFSCGKPDLDDWLKAQAGQRERAYNTRTFLAVDGSKVIGYYATTAYRLGLVWAITLFPRGFDQVIPQALALFLFYFPLVFPVGTTRAGLLFGR